MMTAQKRLVATMLVAAGFAFVPGRVAASPIVLNGTFSAGNNGSFTSGYSYVAWPALPDKQLMVPEGLFTVGTDPAQTHYLWASFGDHTSGDGLAFIANGSLVEGTLVWQAAVSVNPGTLYEFSAWTAAPYPNNPARLAFQINGVELGVPLTTPTIPGVWQEFSQPWYSGTDSTAVMSIVSRSTEQDGNDFLLDDISLREPDPERRSFESVPDGGATLILLGGALLGLGALGRKLGV